MKREDQHWIMDGDLNAQVCRLLSNVAPRTPEHVITRAYRRSTVLLVAAALLFGVALISSPWLSLPAALLTVPGLGFRLAGFTAAQHHATCQLHTLKELS